ncbi:porin family protein [Aliivibrio logei]|uniref:Outer membrane protein beta-barrel domain-containing protein n=1 Tax=Aliivibrio logei 5S-186 TaxID=626086 RepID=A0ABX3AXQ8_ALILO|nr:porin family protein [Aliivibrio logei]OEF19518.1 hypothetical protein A1Q5_18065 [Aliivibrio logei 5S-186]
MKKSILLLALLSACSYANAATNDVSGVYLGGGFGTTDFDDDSALPYNSSIDDNDTTYKLIGGYQFNRIVAVEMQYTNYGDVKVSNYYGSSNKETIEHSSVTLAANVGYTFDNGWRPFAIAGLGSIEQSFKGSRSSSNDSGTAFHFGAGAEYAPKTLGGLAFRVAYEGDLFVVDSGSNNIDDDYSMTIGTLYAGATYKF